MTKTITRLFEDYSDATAALHDLERLGVPHDSVSIVANNADGAHGDATSTLGDGATFRLNLPTELSIQDIKA